MCYQPFHLHIFFPCMLYIYIYIYKFRFKLFLIWKIPSALNCRGLYCIAWENFYLFIYFFLWWVVLFIMRTIREGEDGGRQLQVTLFQKPCQPSCCFQIEVGLTSAKSILHLSFTTYIL